MVDDTRVIALHVLSAAGFGVSHDFHSGARTLTEGHTLSYRDALMVVLALIPSIIANKTPWLSSMPAALFPTKANPILEGTREFPPLHGRDARPRNAESWLQTPGNTKPDLISTLIRTSDEAKAEGVDSSVRLTDDEIKGIVFCV